MATSLPYIWWRGVKLNADAIPSLLTAERHAGPLRMIQGSYNAGGVAASAGTHDGGDVVDISVSGKTNSERTTMLRWLRLCGWAAWLRTPRQGFGYHIHAVRVGSKKASWGAKAQLAAYKRRRNGLAGNGPDDGPWVGVVTWADSKYNPANSRPAKPKKPYVIQGKQYDPWNGPVYVDSVNKARAARKKYVSRPVHRVQLWLKESGTGGYYDGPTDGIWGPKTQAALDSFRRRKLGWKAKSDYSGPLGLTSLRRLRDAADSGYKVAASGGGKVY